MCCYHEVTLGSKETKECVEKPVTDSGYYYTQSHKSSTGENERDTLSCTINIDICYKEGGSAKECSEYSKNVKGGLCCLDKESDVCLSQPYHSQNTKKYECVGNESKIELSLIVLLVGLLAL